MESTSISTGTSTRVSGRTTFQTVRDKQSIQTVVDTTDNFWITKDTAKESLLRRERYLTVISSTIRWTVSGFCNWKTGKGTKGNGWITKSTDSGSINGPTDVCIRAIMWKGKEMVKVKWYTRMERSMRGLGWMVRNMAGGSTDLGRMNLLESGVRANSKRNFTEFFYNFMFFYFRLIHFIFF